MQRSIPTVILLSLAALLFGTEATARDQINIVGSSTVYPFATMVAENFGLTSDFKTPKIESTGTGGGFKLFCEGVGVKTPDITNASRRIKQTEVDMCMGNGVTGIIELKIGYDGIVFANTKKAGNMMGIGTKHLFLALAKEVPSPDGTEKLVPNPYRTWKDIDASLPDMKIEVLGPPPTSGTRDAFAELALEGGCKKFAWIKAMKDTDKSAYKQVCHTVREDGAYIESGENDNLIVQKLKANPTAFGIFGFSFLDQNAEAVRGIEIDGVAPTFDAIAEGSYPISRALYLYTKKTHVGVIPGIKEYLEEFMSSQASGDNGYLADKGLIQAPMEEQMTYRQTLRELATLSAKI